MHRPLTTEEEVATSERLRRLNRKAITFLPMQLGINAEMASLSDSDEFADEIVARAFDLGRSGQLHHEIERIEWMLTVFLTID